MLDQFQDSDNEYSLFAGATYEQDDEEADNSQLTKPWTLVLPRDAQEQAELAKHCAKRSKILQQLADLKRDLSSATDEEWEIIPEVGNLTRKKGRHEGRWFVVPDSVIFGDREKNEYENSLDAGYDSSFIFVYKRDLISFQDGGFETPAESGTLTKLDQVRR